MRLFDRRRTLAGVVPVLLALACSGPRLASGATLERAHHVGLNLQSGAPDVVTVTPSTINLFPVTSSERSDPPKTAGYSTECRRTRAA